MVNLGRLEDEDYFDDEDPELYVDEEDQAEHDEL